MQRLYLKEGDAMIVYSTQLKNASFCKLQPLSEEFVALPDPRVMYNIQPWHFLTCKA